MIIEDNLYIFETTGRKFSTYSTEGISITDYGDLQYGRDGYLLLKDEEGNEDGELELTIEEKKELALYVIKKWMKFADLSNVTIND